MPFDYEANTAAVVQALKDYNTSTASPYLSQSLTSRVINDNIKQDDPEIVGVQGINLPAVYVRVSTGDEEPASIGETGPTKGKKFKTVIYDVIGIYKREGMGSSHSALMNDVHRLAENIEGVFQAEFDLSNTALYCHPRRTAFLGPYQVDGSWAKVVMVELEAKYLFR